jgi:DNA-binding MarR family transcriptional regulator/GNAT superfamily N-acetyltransferase
VVVDIVNYLVDSGQVATETARIDAIRRFNRFYTRIIGALDEGHLDSAYSLAQVRLLYELAHRDDATATDLGRDLGLDAGYLSRMLRELERERLVSRTLSKSDGRQSHLALTAAGRRAFRELDVRAKKAIAALVEPLPDAGRRAVVAAMGTIESALSPTMVPIVVRDHRPGDMGWIVSRQAILYHAEYGWNHEYEALTSRIVADFLDHFDAARERCWVADRDGDIVGSVFLVRHPERKGVAKLRMLYVEPSARGAGLGARLVHECTLFAKHAGYHAITLWTNSVLVSARKLYEAEGYQLMDEQAHRIFGHDLVSQTWELSLRGASGGGASRTTSPTRPSRPKRR